MEGISAIVYKQLTKYWRPTNGYSRLNKRRKIRVIKLANDGSKRPRFWRISRRLKISNLRRFSPKKLLISLRDAYMNMMVKFANSSMISSGGGFGVRPVKEYDERMLVEIYKSYLATQGGDATFIFANGKR